MKIKVVALGLLAAAGIALTGCAAGTETALERECGSIGVKSMTWVPKREAVGRSAAGGEGYEEFVITCNNGEVHRAAVE